MLLFHIFVLQTGNKGLRDIFPLPMSHGFTLILLGFKKDAIIESGSRIVLHIKLTGLHTQWLSILASETWPHITHWAHVTPGTKDLLMLTIHVSVSQKTSLAMWLLQTLSNKLNHIIIIVLFVCFLIVENGPTNSLGMRSLLSDATGTLKSNWSSICWFVKWGFGPEGNL